MSEFKLCAECRTKIRCASQRKCDMPVFHGATRDDIAARERALSGGFGEAPSDYGSNDKEREPLFIDIGTHELCRFPSSGEWSLRIKQDDDVAHVRYLDDLEARMVVAAYEAGLSARSAGTRILAGGGDFGFTQTFDCHYDGDINRCDKNCKQLGECKRRTSGVQSATVALWPHVPVACHNLGIDFLSLRAECERLSNGKG